VDDYIIMAARNRDVLIPCKKMVKKKLNMKRWGKATQTSFHGAGGVMVARGNVSIIMFFRVNSKKRKNQVNIYWNLKIVFG
jgi:hypothetical protein